MAEYLASIFGTEKDKVNCSFYFKIGACRHGDRCSRIHNKPNFSQTCLLQNLYVNPQNSAKSADGSHLVANVSDEEMQEHYDNFFEDVFVECEDKYGEIEEMNVCDNLGDHLVGNVYIKFRREEDAESAVTDLNNRWFGGRPVYAELSPVTDFREACCRQYEMGECTRSGFCNFMHLKPISRELRRTPMGNVNRTRLAIPKSHISRFPKLEQAKETPNMELNQTKPSNRDPHSFFRTEDCAKLLPFYTSIRTRPSQEGIIVEDLDIIQHELETLYSQAAKRQRALRGHVNERKHTIVADKKRKSVERESPVSLKRMKLEDKLKLRWKKLNTMNTDISIRQPRIFKTRNDLWVKFWASVDPYCQNINRKHINYLDELIKTGSPVENLHIPELSKDYAAEWFDTPLLTAKQHWADSKTETHEDHSMTERILKSLTQEKILEDVPLSSYKIKNNFNETRLGFCLDRYLRNGLISDDKEENKSKTASAKDEILEEIERCYKKMNYLTKVNAGALKKLRKTCVKDYKLKTVRELLHRVNPKVEAIRVRNRRFQ